MAFGMGLEFLAEVTLILRRPRSVCIALIGFIKVPRKNLLLLLYEKKEISVMRVVTMYCNYAVKMIKSKVMKV